MNNSPSGQASKFLLSLSAMVLLALIILSSIFRDRFVNRPGAQITVTGVGKVQFQPDIALLILEIEKIKAESPAEALQALKTNLTPSPPL